jgi:septal ring factor EnvC (AmiA/AmiB activator)
LPEGKDRFREARRQKALSRDCKECRAKRQQEELEAAQRRKAEKEKRRMEQSEQPRPGDKPKARLPDGSRFEVQYDGAKQQWSGTLTVPTQGQGTASFTGARSSLFKLLAVLDDQYRASLSGT